MTDARATPCLQQLSAIVERHGRGLGKRKRALLEQLAEAALWSVDDVQRLHESLPHLRAYPDDGRPLEQVDAMLEVGRRPRMVDSCHNVVTTTTGRDPSRSDSTAPISEPCPLRPTFS